MAIAELSGQSFGALSGIGANMQSPLGAAGLGSQSGDSPLRELASMLSEMLLGGVGGKGGGKEQGGVEELLQRLLGGEEGQRGQKAGGRGEDDPAKELLTQVLMALFEKLLGGGEQGGGKGEGGVGAAGGVAGGAPGGAPGALGGGQGAGGAANEDLFNSLMKGLGEGSLNQSIDPSADGGGQVSQDGRLKELLEMIAQFMDSHPQAFGTPSGAAGGGSGGGQSLPQQAVGQASGSPAPAAAGGGSGGGAAVSSAPAAAAPAENAGAAAAPQPQAAGATAAAPLQAGGASSAAVAFPTAAGNATVVNETIKVGPGEVFDGGGKTFTAGAALGDGGQSEGQKPLFELAEGATLKNVVFGENAADGVHVKAGSDKAVNVDNVHWTNVGEDALTVKDGGAKTTNLNITNSSAQGAHDKVFQLNADANVKVDNFKVKDFGTFMRTNGGQQGNWNLDLSDISAENGKFSFVKSDSEGLNLSTRNIDLKNVENAFSKLPDSTNITRA